MIPADDEHTQQMQGMLILANEVAELTAMVLATGIKVAFDQKTPLSDEIAHIKNKVDTIVGILDAVQ